MSDQNDVKDTVVEEPTDIVTEEKPVADPVTTEVTESVDSKEDVPEFTVVDELAFFKLEDAPADTISPVVTVPITEPVKEDVVLDEHEVYMHCLRSLGMEEISHYSKSDMNKFYLTGDRLPKSKSGLYVRSILRDAKPINDYNVIELKGLLNGELEYSAGVTKQDAINASRIKFNIPVSYTDSNVVSYVVDNRPPERTLHGILRRDRVRECKLAAHWSDLELACWANGEIDSNSIAPEKDLLKAIADRMNLPQDYGKQKLKDAIKSTLNLEITDIMLDIIRANLTTYVNEMRPSSRITEVAAANHQRMLMNTVNNILNADAVDFSQYWTYLLDVVAENRDTVFSESNAYRGTRTLNLPEKQILRFRNIMTLLMNTGPIESRYTGVDRINKESLAISIPDENQRQKLLAYYRIK